MEEKWLSASSFVSNTLQHSTLAVEEKPLPIKSRVHPLPHPLLLLLSHVETRRFHYEANRREGTFEENAEKAKSRARFCERIQADAGRLTKGREAHVAVGRIRI